MHAIPGWLLTFMFVNATWVFFRATDLNSALRIFKGMSGFNDLQNIVTNKKTLLFILIFGLIALIAPNTMQVSKHQLSYNGRFIYKQSPLFAFVSGCAGGLGILLLLTTTGSEFLYFNF